MQLKQSENTEDCNDNDNLEGLSLKKTNIPESPATLEEHQHVMLIMLKELDGVCKQLNIPYTLFAGSLLGAVRHKGFIPWDDDLDVLMMREDYERFLAHAEELLDKDKYYLQREFSDHWPMPFSKLRMNNTTCIEKYHPKDKNVHQGIYIDIFPCDNAGPCSFARVLQFVASKVVIAKALDRRGYDTDSLIKTAFIKLCRLIPEKRLYCFSVSGNHDSKYVHTFYGASRSLKRCVYPRSIFEKRLLLEFEGCSFPCPAGYDKLLKILYGDYNKLPDENVRKSKVHAIMVDTKRAFDPNNDFRDGIVFRVKTRSIR